MVHVLDRPVWSALSGCQAELGVGDIRARRFRPEINLFAANAEGTGDGLAQLCCGGVIGTVETAPISVPGLTLVKHSIVNQMVADTLPDVVPLEAQPLGAPNAAEMLALATLTEPGPFLSETWRMGHFVGVREGGRLIAMAGQRMRAPGFTEVSAVCTHPEFRGRGLAGKLMRIVIDRIVRAGDGAFLHVYPDNHGAIGLYETLGFRSRCQLHFQTWAALKPPSPARAPSSDRASPAPRAG